MRRPLRLQHDPAGDGGVVDFSVDVAPTATVGDLADALARAIGAPSGLTVASRWPHDQRGQAPRRDDPLMTHGPRAGATVLLTSSSGRAAPATAPVRLIGPAGREVALSYGPNGIGSARIDVTDHVTVRAEGGGDVRIGGRSLVGACRATTGDLLTIGELPWTLRIEGDLHPPQGAGWTHEHRSRPAELPPGTLHPVRLPSPPQSARAPRFPTLSASVPLLMGVALWWATGSLLAAGFMGMSTIFVIASGIESRRESRAEDRQRVAEFRTDLAEAVTALRDRAELQRRAHAAQGLSPDEVRALSRGERAVAVRIWERSALGGKPSMSVRVGTGRRVLGDRPDLPYSGRRELREELTRQVEALSDVDDVIVVDLRETRGIVVEGPDGLGTAVARSLLVQLCALVDPHQIAVEVRASGDRLGAWRFVDWLPHRETSHGITQVVVVDGVVPDNFDHHPDRVVIWVTPTGGPRPVDVTAMLHVDDEGGTLWIASESEGVSDGAAGPLQLEPLEVDDAEPLARRLCPLVPAPSTMVDDSADGRPADHLLPHTVSLSDVAASASMVVAPDAVLEHWQSSTGAHLAAPVGVDRHGATVNLDLSSDGPHALIAGTTGAGKSELLRTFLVTTAMHHPPDRVNLLLIDYKGGAAFGPLGVLPHTVGTITDLSGDLADRALRSLRAELRRRESILAGAQLDHWTGPALLVVVDELATLVSELPSFVDGLVDLAQRGRSLGVHLVLATQRPAGVVTEAIRANVTTRICLRVASEDDSTDVVGVGSAAHLPREVPGRALVRLGSERVTPIQVARCGPLPQAGRAVDITPCRMPARSRTPSSYQVAISDTHSAFDPGPEPGRSALDELQLAIAAVVEAAHMGQFPTPHRPWLDPLPEALDRLDCRAAGRQPDSPTSTSTPTTTATATLVIGVVDVPDEQRRDDLRIDFNDGGGALVVGVSGSGKTAAVKALIMAAAECSADRWHVHVVEGGGQPGHLHRIGVVGDVVATHDVERVRRLLRDTLAEIERRSALHSKLSSAAGLGSAAMPRRMLVVDGIASFEHQHGNLDRGAAMDHLARIAREGRAVGIHLVITAQRRGEVPMELLGLIGARIILRCSSADEASLWGLDESAANPTSMPPGRCRSGTRVAQIFWHGDAALGTAAELQVGAAAVPRCPTHVRIEEVTCAGDGRWALPLGIDADQLTATAMDLTHHHAIVAGPPRSGVSTALEVLADGIDGSILVRGDDPSDLSDAVDRAIAHSTSGRRQLVVVDEASFGLDGPDGDEFAAQLERLVTAARQLELRLVIGGEVDSLLRSYHDVIARIRRGRTGVMLGGDPDAHAALWHATVGSLSDLPDAAGRGWLFGPGSAVRVQVASR